MKDNLKRPLSFAGLAPKLCKNCVYMFGGQFGVEADTCKKRGVVVAYDNTCNFFEDRRLAKQGKKRRFEKNQTNFGKTLDKRENFVYNIKMRKIGFFVVTGRLNLQKTLYLFTKKSEIFCKQYGAKM